MQVTVIMLSVVEPPALTPPKIAMAAPSRESGIVDQKCTSDGWGGGGVLAFEHHFVEANCRSLMCIYTTHHIAIRGWVAVIGGSSGAIITHAPSFTSYE